MQTIALLLKRLAVLLIFASLAGCCWDTCLAPSDAATVSFRFSADTLRGTGFRQAEIRSAYVVEYADDRLTQPKDTLRLSPAPKAKLLLFERRRIQLYFFGDSVYNTPVASYYRIIVPTVRQFDIRHVGLTVTRSNRCQVACNEVKGIGFSLNGQPVALPVANTYADGALELSR